MFYVFSGLYEKKSNVLYFLKCHYEIFVGLNNYQYHFYLVIRNGKVKMFWQQLRCA